jgi:hypothetical protein
MTQSNALWNLQRFFINWFLGYLMTLFQLLRLYNVEYDEKMWHFGE